MAGQSLATSSATRRTSMAQGYWAGNASSTAMDLHRNEADPLVVERAALAAVGRPRADEGVGAAAVGDVAAFGHEGHVAPLVGIVLDADDELADGGDEPADSA